jgi:primosomal protein N''
MSENQAQPAVLITIEEQQKELLDRVAYLAENLVAEFHH